MKKILILFILFIFSCQNKSHKILITGELKKWHKVTLIFDGLYSSEYAKDNPFLNYRLYVTFKNENKKFIVPGYYAADGNSSETSAESGKIWKVHFRPNKTGNWKYNVSFQKGKNLSLKNLEISGEPTAFDNANGEFIIEKSNKSGKDFRSLGRIKNGDKGYFKFTDKDSIFFKNGTNSPENFLAYEDFDQTYRYEVQNRSGESNPKDLIHKYASHVKDWKKGDPTWKKNKGKGIIGAINYLSNQGVNSIYMISLNILSDGKDVWPYSDHNERYRFDCSKLDQWEIVFDHMERKGVMLHLLTQETENETLLDNGETSVQRKVYYKELIARFGHHLGIIWNMGEENGPSAPDQWSPIGQTDKQRLDMAKYIKQNNPFEPIIFLHSHADNKSQDKYLNPLIGKGEYDGASMQIGEPKNVNSRIYNFSEKSEIGGKKWIVSLDELGPHWKGVMPDSFDKKHDTIRNHALWGSVLAGAGGVEWYFGWKYPHADLTCEDFRSRELWWKQSKIAVDFITNYPMEEMKKSTSLLKNFNTYGFSKKDEIHLIYLPYVKKNIFLNMKTDINYEIKWFNPRSGGKPIYGDKKYTSAKSNHIGQPPFDLNKDWVVVLNKI